ncbi:MAG TPA: LysM domain-containing protein [Lacunisphaera sp.]|nr:LysM domain-containing protein [Lacunisphaera sp.]
MDTLSRDSNSSGNILAYVGVGAGVLALILAGVALAKLSTLQKTVAEHAAEIPRIATIEGEVRAAATKNETDLKNLRDGVQGAFNQFSTTLGTIQGQITKLEEAQKAKAAAPAKAGAAPTGVLNSDGTYSVAPGDNFSKIARKFAVKLDALEAENPGIDTRGLKVGQKIRIPKK